jgi:hypothetical protein
MSVRFPESLHKQLKGMARREGISINQLITTAVAEKMSALMTADYLEERARRGSRAKFEAVLAKVPSVEPDPWDRWEGAEPYDPSRLGSDKAQR